MRFQEKIYRFMDMVANDPRIGPTHISLYLAVLYFYRRQSFDNPVQVFSRDLMKQAKIASSATYFGCLRDLKEMGFVKYVPSNNPFLGSLVYLE